MICSSADSGLESRFSLVRIPQEQCLFVKLGGEEIPYFGGVCLTLLKILEVIHKKENQVFRKTWEYVWLRKGREMGIKIQQYYGRLHEKVFMFQNVSDNRYTFFLFSF